MNTISILLIHILLIGFNSTAKDEILGKWFMQKVIQDGKDVTSEHDPHGERYIIFKSDSSFESGGKPFGTNTGKYSYSVADQTLVLDSDAGPEDDSQWKVTLQGNQMHWQGQGSEWALGFEIIQVKKNDK